MTNLTEVQNTEVVDEEEFDTSSEAVMYIEQLLKQDPLNLFPIIPGAFDTEIQFQELLNFLVSQSYVYAPDAKNEDDIVFDSDTYAALLEKVLASMYSYFNFTAQILGLAKLYTNNLTNSNLIPIDLEAKKYGIKIDDLFKSPDIPIYLFVKALFKFDSQKQLYPNVYNIDNIMNFYSILPSSMRDFLNKDMEKIIKKVYPAESQ